MTDDLDPILHGLALVELIAKLGDAMLRRCPRLAARAVRTDDPQTDRAGDAPRCLRQPRVVGHLTGKN